MTRGFHELNMMVEIESYVNEKNVKMGTEKKIDYIAAYHQFLN